MKRILRVFLAAIFSVSLAGASVAGDFSMDPSTVGSSTGNIDNIFGFTFFGASNVQYTSGTGTGVGDSFVDNGVLTATILKSSSITNIPNATSGLGNTWELGVIFNGLTGSNTSVTGDEVEFSFNAGAGIIQVYASATLNGQPNDPGSVADGTLVAELEVLSGTGDFDFEANDGRINILAQFVNLPVAGFWDHLGEDIELGDSLFIALTDSNNDLIEADQDTIDNFSDHFGGTAGGNNPPLNFFVSNDGSVELQLTAVPEPASMILLGFGLLGSAAWVRRRSRKEK